MRSLKLVLPFILLLAACGAPQQGAPTVSSTVPSRDAAAVALNLPISVTFDAAMDPATFTVTTFTLKQGATDVAGAVSYADKTATFTPAAALGGSLPYTATISTGAKSVAGAGLAEAYTWSFTTVAPNAPPSITSTKPLHDAVNVWKGQRISASFNLEMEPTSLTPTSFSVRQGSVSVAGRVSYSAASNTVTFTPDAPLGALLPYTATISTAAKSASGRSLPMDQSWTFTTRDVTPALPVDLGTAGNYVILAKTQISTVPSSVITGDIAVSPAAATFITGFGLTADATTMFSTSPQVTGKVYAADYTSPTSSNLTTAVSDMGTAFVDAAGRAPDVTELAAGNIGGMTLASGVYKWGTGLLIPTDLHLNGSATDVWVFEIAQDLTVSSATSVVLSGGALAKNIFWQVSGAVDLGTTSHFEGIILSQTAITLRTGSSINGRLLAQSAVSLDSSTVVEPAP